MTGRRARAQGQLDEWRDAYVGMPVPVDFRAATGTSSGVDRLTHLLHPYPAKLLAAIPQFFLSCEELVGAAPRVLDPFCGSGTVLLEGLVAGGAVAGADVNPLARLITRAKTTVMSPDRLVQARANLLTAAPRRGAKAPPGPIQLDRWYAPRVARRLSRLISGLDAVVDADERVFLQACLSVVVQRCSLADPLISVPVRLNPERPGLTPVQRVERWRWLRERRQADPFAIFDAVVETNVARMSRLDAALPAGGRACLFGDARGIPADGLFDVVITSPPYASAQKYVRSTSLSLQWLGLAPDGLRAVERLTIGREHFDRTEISEAGDLPVADAGPLLARIREINPLRAHIAGRFLVEMAEALARARDALRPGGTLVLVVGDNMVCGERFPTSRLLRDVCAGLGLDLELELVDRIKSRGLMTRRNATAGIIAEEWIGVFRRAVV